MRLAPSQRPDGRHREWDTFKHSDIAPELSLERAAGQMDERSFGRYGPRPFRRYEEHWNGKTKKPHKGRFPPGLRGDAEIGIESEHSGCVVAYAHAVRTLRRFAEALIRNFHFGLRRRPVAYFRLVPSATASRAYTSPLFHGPRGVT